MSTMAAVIDALLQAGFLPDGETRTEVVRVPTTSSPLFGLSGGELAKFGGRQRFALGTSGIKATVGKRTTAVYRMVGAGLAGVQGIASFDTGDLEKLRQVLAEIDKG